MTIYLVPKTITIPTDLSLGATSSVLQIKIPQVPSFVRKLYQLVYIAMERNKTSKYNMCSTFYITQNRDNKEDVRGKQRESLDCITPSYIKTSSKQEGVIQSINKGILRYLYTTFTVFSKTNLSTFTAHRIFLYKITVTT